MAGKAETSKRIVDRALALAADRPWRDISLGDIAEAAAIGLPELHKHYGSKTAILVAFIERIDGEVLAGSEAARTASDPEKTHRDRLFDVLVRRLEALKPHKAGVQSVARSLSSDPLSLACLMPCYARSMAWMLESAGIGGSGVRGRLRARGLGLVYLSTLRAWFRDDQADMAKTRAALDRALGRADFLVKSAPFLNCLGASEPLEYRAEHPE